MQQQLGPDETEKRDRHCGWRGGRGCAGVGWFFFGWAAGSSVLMEDERKPLALKTGDPIWFAGMVGILRHS